MRYGIIAALFFCISVLPAQAAHRHHYHRHYAHAHHHRHHRYVRRHYRPVVREYAQSGSNVARARSRGLPWCGAFMSDYFHIGGAAGRMLWVARNWARKGVATIAHIGAVVVWSHHVGIITGGSPGHWEVTSGNDGHRVRTRERSLRGAIAFRQI